MDKATVVGLFLGVGLVLGSIFIGGGGLMPFVDVPSLMITVGGSFAAILINFPMPKVMQLIPVIRNCFFTSLPEAGDVIAQFKSYATTARRDGLLALENDVAEIEDEFLKRGMEQVVGGASREDLQAGLDSEVGQIESRHQTGKKIVDAIAAAAPAFGMIGTLIGLVQMLRSLDDPSQIGGGMAVALLTTLYGAVIANLFCIPLAGKLEARNSDEMVIRELMISGLISLVEGQAPRAVEEKLLSFIAPRNRGALIQTEQAA